MFEVSDRRQAHLVSTATEGLACSYHHGNRVSPVYDKHSVLDGILDASTMPRKVMLAKWNKSFVCVKRDPTIIIDGTANLPSEQLFNSSKKELRTDVHLQGLEVMISTLALKSREAHSQSYTYQTSGSGFGNR